MGDQDEEEPSSEEVFKNLLKEWDDEHTASLYDPTKLLHSMANVLEKETNIYMAKDPDPFEERHPSRVDPDCLLGSLLKLYFKKDALVQEVFTNYMRENYFTRGGQDKSSFELNIAACRLVLDILPGLENVVLSETDGLIPQLYKWVTAGIEPLASYATGLLAVAMELNDVVTDGEIREKNSKLVPEVLARLRQAQEQTEKEKQQAGNERFKRPFALFSKSPIKTPRRISQDDEVDQTDDLAKPLPSTNMVTPGWPSNGIVSPPRYENSGSSWAEMELDVIGHFEIYPLSSQASQIFILRLLCPLAEYQDFLPLAQGTKILEILVKYINVRQTRDARLAFEALKLLASLFCHKKFTLEWVDQGGLELLMHMPRPSMAATGSSLCLYYLACDDDTMEKICSLPPHTLQQLVRYCLWLLECSHDTGRQYAIMFFGLSLPFRNILQIFDSNDGLRKLYNNISTLAILSDKLEDRESVKDDQEFTQRQMVRYTTQTLKSYIEIHLAIRLEKEVARDLESMGGSPQPPHSSIKPQRLDQDQVTEAISTLLQLTHYRSRWEPVDRLIKLGGVQLLLQVIALSYDWTFAGRSETVKCGLDVLAVASVVPRVQLALCEKIDMPEEPSGGVGINILLGAAEGEIVPDSPEVQRAALLVLIHLLCGPVVRPGCVSHPETPTPSKKRPSVKTSSEVINRVWECVRSHNGIMALLQLIQTKIPLSDADSIRTLACRALVGLARSPTATQIMSKLPIFSNGVLNQLLREPVLQDKRAEHVKFQLHAHQLIEKVSGPMSRKNYENNDITLEMLHRASVVANTKIRYNDNQLYSLIHEHLVLSGLTKTAALLKEEQAQLPGETEFIPLVPDNVPPVYHGRGLISFHPSHLNRRLISSPTPNPTARSNTTSRPINTRPSQPITTVRPETQTASSTSNQTPIRVNRPNRTSAANPYTTQPVTPRPSVMKSMEPESGTVNETEDERKVSLCSIVSDFLANQHALCRNPMSICPEFDLFQPHQCPDKRSRQDAPLNIVSRLSKRSLYPPYGGPDGAKLDRKLIYSRFRPVRSFRGIGDDREDNVFTSCAFSGDSKQLYAGTYMGDVKVFDLGSSEETTQQCHDSYVYHVQPSRDNRLVITSSSWRTPYSKLWRVGSQWEEQAIFREEEYLEFSHLSQDKMVGTQADGVATIYDVATGVQTCILKPTTYNAYSRNRATFDPTDSLVLSDGVLWDYRAPRIIHKFDKLNQTLSGVFHPNGLEIISNTEIWDIRTFHLLRTVPQLDQCQIVFNTTGDIIFGIHLEQELEDETYFEKSFKTFEASDYSLISTVNTRKGVLGLCTSRDDLGLAVVEQVQGDTTESVVRLYDVGCVRAEEEDQEDDGEDDDGQDNDGDESDSDDGGPGLDDWGIPIPMFSDVDDMSGSGTGSEDDGDDEVDLDDEDEDLAESVTVEDGDDDDDNSWEDIDVEEEVGG